MIYIYKYTQHHATGGSWSIITAIVKTCHRHSPSALNICSIVLTTARAELNLKLPVLYIVTFYKKQSLIF